MGGCKNQHIPNRAQCTRHGQGLAQPRTCPAMAKPNFQWGHAQKASHMETLVDVLPNSTHSTLRFQPEDPIFRRQWPTATYAKVRSSSIFSSRQETSKTDLSAFSKLFSDHWEITKPNSTLQHWSRTGPGTGHWPPFYPPFSFNTLHFRVSAWLAALTTRMTQLLSMPLAILRAQSITYNHFACP